VDNTLKLWDAAAGAEIRTLTGHDSDVAFSPDGTRIISASRDNTLKLWDAATGAEIHTLSAQGGHTSVVTSAAFSPDGRWIVSASVDNTLKLWDAENGVCLATFYADAPLMTCAWSPDGVHLVAGGEVGGMYWLRWVAPV